MSLFLISFLNVSHFVLLKSHLDCSKGGWRNDS